jgi:hypothetical protein
MDGEKGRESGQLVSRTRINLGLPKVTQETHKHCKRWCGGKIYSKLAPVSLHQAIDAQFYREGM